MAIAFVNSRPFLTSNIIGATTEQQLLTNLSAEAVTLEDDILSEIDEIHADIPNPAP
jgi:aryl-alcohol dehydrogenase-like predicted oxidoreductase